MVDLRKYILDMSDNKRPDKQFKLLELLKKELSNDDELKKLPYKKKLNEIMKIYYYLNKQIETDLATYDLRINFDNILGEIIFHDDMNSPLNDNAFDALITECGRNKTVSVRFGEKTLKIQFKMMEPMAKTSEISLSQKQVNKYIKEKCSIIFIFKNTTDPNYYNEKVNNLLYFPNRITAEGYQYYLLPYERLQEGKRGRYNNLYYKVKHNGIMSNIGLRYKLGQLNLGDFDEAKTI